MPASPPLVPLTAPVREALARLGAAGFSAYLVGGCVRDALLGMTPHDYDLCTSATPPQIKACFAGERVLETGARHGTVTVLLDGQALEITTFRVDGAYRDGRRPERVTFSASVQEDLARRDFTVNAMAYSGQSGLVDPFGGRADLARGVIRCVGEPERRFSEDALRILRAARFAAALGFTVEEGTAQAMCALRGRLACVSAERIAAELNRLLVGKDAAGALAAFPEVLFAALPLLAPMLDCRQRNPYHCADVWTHTLRALAHAPAVLSVRWAALLHDSGKPETRTTDAQGVDHFYGHQACGERIARETLLALRQPNALIERVCTLVALHDDCLTERNCARYLARLGAGAFDELLALQRADLLAHAPHVHDAVLRLEAVAEKKERLLAQGACLSLRDLQVNGRDMLALGLSGRAVGAALQGLLARVLAGELQNERGALLAAARAQKEKTP